jgi:hypothetical protein
VLEKYAETKKNRTSFVGSCLIVFGLAMSTMKIFFILFCVGFSFFKQNNYSEGLHAYAR